MASAERSDTDRKPKRRSTTMQVQMPASWPHFGDFRAAIRFARSLSRLVHSAGGPENDAVVPVKRPDHGRTYLVYPDGEVWTVADIFMCTESVLGHIHEMREKAQRRSKQLSPAQRWKEEWGSYRMARALASREEAPEEAP